VLAMCWQCAGNVLAMCWQCAGNVLAYKIWEKQVKTNVTFFNLAIQL